MGRRVFVDNDDKRYQFNCDAFSEIINKKIMLKRNDGQRITKNKIRNDLADLLFASPETIKKWDSNGGPSDLEQVKKCSEYFGIDYHNLLIPLDNQEDNTMNNKDKELVNKVFEEIVNTTYSINNRKKLRSVLPKEEKKDAILKDLEIDKKELLSIGRIIDVASLETSSVVRNKLHRIIIETYDFFFSSSRSRRAIPERWDDDIISCSNEDGIGGYLLMFPYEFELDYFDNRDEIMEDRPITYLDREISMADKYGFECIEYLPEDWWYDEYPEENGISASECSKYGYQSEGYFEFTPIDIYIDMVVETLTAVFKYDFWGEHLE